MKRTLPGKCGCTNDIKWHSISNLQKVQLTHALTNHEKTVSTAYFRFLHPFQKLQQPNDCLCCKGLAECKALLKSKGHAPCGPKFEEKRHAPFLGLAFSSWPLILSRCKRRCQGQKGHAPCGPKFEEKRHAPFLGLAFSSWPLILSRCKRRCQGQKGHAPCGPKFEEKHDATLWASHSALGHFSRKPTFSKPPSWLQISEGWKMP